MLWNFQIWKVMFLYIRSLGTDHLTWRWGLWFFVSFRNYFSDNTRVRIFIYFCRAEREFFFPEFTIRLYDNNSESDFFSLHQNQNVFFSNIGNQNIPPLFQVKWSFPNSSLKCAFFWWYKFKICCVRLQFHIFFKQNS